jgi:hypothetical protein
MVSMVNPRRAEVSDDLLLVDSPPLRERLGEPEFSDECVPIAPPSFARRASRAFVRFVFACGVGVGATLAWQSYGDAARETVATWAEQQGWSIGWLRPEGAPAPSAPAQAAAEIAPPASAADLQQVKSMTLSMVSTLTTMKERIDQMAAAQVQTASDVGKLQAAEQEIRQKISTLPSRPAAQPPSRPASAASPRAPVQPH